MKKQNRQLAGRKSHSEPMAFAPVARGANSLTVTAAREDGETRIALIGSIGKTMFDEGGITESEVRDAIDSVPVGKKIEMLVNSEGGSVKEGLGISDAIYDRRSDIRVRITGYALSIASVFPLSAKKSLGGRGVISARGSMWMEHQASCIDKGNADEKRQTAEMLEMHDDAMATLYSRATGLSKEAHLARMKKTTWTKGEASVAAGLADESDDSPVALRPLSKEFLARFENVPAEIIAAAEISAPPQGAVKPAASAAKTTPQPMPAAAGQPQENTMNKLKIVALLNTHGIKDSAGKELTEQSTDAEFETALNILAKKSGLEAVARMEAIEAKLALAEKRRLTDKVSAYVDAQKITKAEVPIFVNAALNDESGTMAILEAKESSAAGGSAAGLDIQIVDNTPNISKDGVQGSKIVPELENIFAQNKVEGNRVATAQKRFEAMKEEWPRILRAATRRDNGVQASNTFTGTFTTNFLILGVTTKLFNRFAAARLFTRDNTSDPYKPLAAGIMKFNATTTDGTKVGTGVTNFETLAGSSAGNDDSDIEPVTITPLQYTSGGHVTNAELNSGLRIADLVEAKLIDLADKVTQVLTAPITVANFTTNAALISAPAAFGFSDLADLQGTLKKSPVKNLLLDGEYLARISNRENFFQPAGTVGGSPSAWQGFGWDNIALNTEWSGAGANVRGFACGRQAIGIITGLPLNPPEGIPGNIVQTGVAMLPDVGIGISTYAWFSAQARTFFFTYDIIAGATLLDETAGRLVKSA